MTNRAVQITLTTTTEAQSLRDLELEWSAFGIVCYLQLRQREGREAPTRDELVNGLPISERTLDGALADLKRRGLIRSVKIERVA